MHEICFAEVACPQKHVVLNLPLRNFSIGHRILLLRQRNPLLWADETFFNQLIFQDQVMWLVEAVFICATSFAERIRLEQPSVLGWRQALNWLDVKGWHWRRGKTDWAAETAKFHNYLNASRVITEYNEQRDGFPFLPCTRSDDAKGRSLGAPYEALLIQFLVGQGLCRGEAEALEYPYGAAVAHYLTYREKEGALKIINAEEFDFEESCRERDEKAAKEAGFESVAAHAAAMKLRAVSAKKPTDSAPAGLATEPPGELKTTTPHPGHIPAGRGDGGND